MLLHVKSTSMSIAVISFFGLGFVGWISDLSPFMCCKRALIGAIIAYIAAGFGAKAINHILTNAMLISWTKQQKDKTSGSRN